MVKEEQPVLSDHLRMTAKDPSKHMPVFGEALRNDAALRQEVETMLSRLTDDVTGRCVISKRTRDYIRAALVQAAIHV